jgi:hypothetical protein
VPINAAILVSYVLENKTWKGSAKRLDFWRYILTPTSELSEALKQWRAEREKEMLQLHQKRRVNYGYRWMAETAFSSMSIAHTSLPSFEVCLLVVLLQTYS